MDPNNLFFVSFEEGKSPRVIHSKCEHEAITQDLLYDNQKTILFCCSFCKDRKTVYFLRSVWDKILNELKQCPHGTKIVIKRCDCQIVGKTVLSEQVFILEKRL